MRFRGALVAVLVLAAGALAPAGAFAQQARLIAARVMPSIVFIEVTTPDGDFLGSGFVVAPGIVATAYHVVEGMTSGTVRFVNRTGEVAIDAILAFDPARDLALIAVDTGNAKPLPLADSSQVTVGDPVWALGNPEGFEGTISEGIVSAVRLGDGIANLQITNSTFPGSSGGPIVNAFAEVVGVLLSGIGETLNFVAVSNDVATMLGQVGATVPPQVAAQPASPPAVADAPAPASGEQPAAADPAMFAGLAPTYGTLALAAGFSPDPAVVEGIAGGAVAANSRSAGCNGFVSNSPDVILDYTAGTLNLYLSALSATDTTLQVLSPDGQWHCDDDGAGDRNPLVTITQPDSGLYLIWLGTFDAGAYPAAVLNISELSPN